MRKILFVLLIQIFSLFSGKLTAQNVISGKIIDGGTNKPIPFANVLINNGAYTGISDYRGNFHIQCKGNIYDIIFKKSGFYTFKYQITFSKDRLPLQRTLSIKLFKSDSTSKKVKKISPNAIIDKFISTRKKNDYKHLKSYGNYKYQKSYFTLSSEKKLKPLLDSLRKLNNDSSLTKRQRKKLTKEQRKLYYFFKNYLYLEEIQSKAYKSQPSYIQEITEKYKSSGFESPHILNLLFHRKAINFYNAKISFYGREFIHPLSNLGKKSYDFFVKDTLTSHNGNWLVLKFQPILYKKLNLLSGEIYIGLDDFAIRSISLKTLPQKQKAQIILTQHFKQIKNKYVPDLLKYQVLFPKKIAGIPLAFIQKINFNNHQINPTLNKQGFKKSVYVLNKPSSDKELSDISIQTTDLKTKSTYTYLDTVGKKYHFNTLGRISDLVIGKKYPIRDLLTINTSQTSLNFHEGLRLGFGLESFPYWSDIYSGSLYLAYGFKDKVLKYGGSAKMIVSDKYQADIEITFKKDVEEPGLSRFLLPNPLKSSMIFRDFLQKRMDRIEQFTVMLNAFPYYNLNVKVGLSRNFIAPQYTYNFAYKTKENATEYLKDFSTAEILLQASYTFKRNTNQINKHTFDVSPSVPYIHIKYQKGFSGILGSKFNYHKLLIETAYCYDWLAYGKTYATLQMGFINNNLPYPILFNGKGNFEPGYIFSSDGHFEVMPRYQFLSDRFVNLFIRHSLDKLLYFPRNKWFQPRFEIVQNIGFGLYTGVRNFHQGIDFDDMKLGYYETGIVAKDLLRLPISNVVNLNLGSGFFIRYGAYNSKNNLENIALKLRAILNF